MALQVEDGTGRSDADSYLSLASALAYHAAFGNTAWADATDEAQETALRRATQYLDTRYAYRGEPLNTTQALQWPRYVDWTSIAYTWPVKRVTDACAELALRALSGPLYVDQDAVGVKQETVGPISVTYQDARNGGQVRFSAVDDILAPLLGGGGRGTLRIERAS